MRAGIGRRATGIAAALLLEGLLLLLLLSLGRAGSQSEETVTLVDFKAMDASEPAPETPEPEPQRAERAAPTLEPLPPRPAEPQTVAAAPPAVVLPREQPAPAAPARRSPPVAADAPVQGPPDRRSRSSPDTARVGTAPNGEPLYAAAWYREPYPDELLGYLSTATGPGWGLIACRTAPDYRVEDCVGLDESPRGSMIARAALAAAWQFKVRPPRLGGRVMVGEWVRIRIDYEVRTEAR